MRHKKKHVTSYFSSLERKLRQAMIVPRVDLGIVQHQYSIMQCEIALSVHLRTLPHCDSHQCRDSPVSRNHQFSFYTYN